MNSETAAEKLEEVILEITAQKKPKTVSQLVGLVGRISPASKDHILDAIVKLQNEGRLQLKAPLRQPTGVSLYVKTSALWFWATIALELGALTAAFTVPEAGFPIVYVRYLLGAVLIFFLPGYALTKVLFPNQLPYKTNDKNLNTVERIALAIGLSLALVPLVGLVLYYTPWGINLTSVVLSLIALTTMLAVAGIMKEHRMRNMEKS